jgi:hypothetical protein
MRRAALLLVVACGCNQVLGIGDVHVDDSNRPDAAPTCPVVHFDAPICTPVQRSAFALEEPVGGSASFVPYTYLLEGQHGLNGYDLTTPTAPMAKGHLEMTAFGAVVIGDHLLAIATGIGVQIVDVADPNTPTAIGPLIRRGDGSTLNVSSLATEGPGHVLWALDFPNTLVGFDVSNPAAPVEVGHLDVGPNDYALALSGHFLYVSTNEAIAVIDVTDPASPQRAPDLGIRYASSMTVSGDYLYIPALSAGGLIVADISNPGAPQCIAVVADLPGVDRVVPTNNGRMLASSVQELAGSDLEILEITDPAHPRLLGSWSAGSANGVAYGVELFGDDAALVSMSTDANNMHGGAHLVDISSCH